ncbi:hypothetical protein SLEP1_g15769 [Rubroshorea leprosula]|uniref:Amino acid transporter transmembrane domain-containing protein n=1 Tax=Rubroshorea leprosula TaxID=152421 RepID=A0AAV5IZ04_9ROSI|nr:hypothetical protein SLEP1_g15769 [Rubroshorea leprosula]
MTLFLTATGERTSLTGIEVGLGLNAAEKVWTMLRAVGDMAFAFAYSTVLIEIQDTLKSSPPENQTMKKANTIGMSTATTLYLFCSCLGYAAFGDHAPVLEMALPFFNDILALLEAIGFWPMTVYFPVEICSSLWIPPGVESGSQVVQALQSPVSSLQSPVSSLQSLLSFCTITFSVCSIFCPQLICDSLQDQDLTVPSLPIALCNHNNASICSILYPQLLIPSMIPFKIKISLCRHYPLYCATTAMLIAHHSPPAPRLGHPPQSSPSSSHCAVTSLEIDSG